MATASDYEYVLLRDGGRVLLRPFTDADTTIVDEFLSDLSERSKRLRFHSAGINPTADSALGSAGAKGYVAEVEGTVVGVGSFVPLTDPTWAETSAVISDDEQGRGVGTRLYERIARDARSEGILHLLAFVLVENREMIGMLEPLGYRVRRAEDPQTLELVADALADPELQELADRRDHVAATASLEPLWHPRSVAVLGASRRPDAIGTRILANIKHGGFTGPLYAINPSAAEIEGVPAYPSAASIPGGVDLVVNVVPAARTLEAMRDAVAAGARAAIIITAGFAELGESGREQQRELLELVRSAGVRMVGPNCLGLLRNEPGHVLNATFSPALPPLGGIAVASQSGALGIAILEQAKSLGIGISAFVSLGNKAELSSNDLLESWEDDARTTVIALYLESFGNPRRFGRIARRLSQRKPVVVVKAGRSEAGASAASSHTAALASSDTAAEALFGQAGVTRCDTLEEMLDVLPFFESQPLPAGRRVAVVTNAGGLGILFVDAGESEGLRFPEPSEETRAALAELLPAEASVRNPIDMLASAQPDTYRRVLRLVHDDPGIDAVVSLYVPPLVSDPHEIAAAIRAACDDGMTKPLAAVFVQADGAPVELNPPGSERRIPVYSYPESAARVLGHATRLASYRRRPRGAVAQFEDVDSARADAICRTALAADDSAWLEPQDARAVLEAYGIRFPRGIVVHSAEAARAAFEALDGGPVAVKILSKTIQHKTDVGGVRLGRMSAAETGDAFVAISAALERRGVLDQLEGMLVQEMIQGGIETLVGVAADPAFGPLIGFGLGGVTAELMRDVAFRITPLTDLDADATIASTRAAKLLAGYRGAPAGDVPAVKEAILRVSQLVEDIPLVAELDINPLVALRPGEGAIALDCRIRVARPA